MPALLCIFLIGACVTQPHPQMPPPPAGQPGVDVALPNTATAVLPAASTKAVLPQTVDYRVPREVRPLDQGPGTNHCWLTVATMMLNWKDGGSRSIARTAASMGEPYTTYFRTNSGLPGSRNGAFTARLGLRAEPPMNPSAQGWRSLLRAHGPLVITHANPGLAWGHMRIMVGISGDGTGEGTLVEMVDPAGARRYRITLSQFARDFERWARESHPESSLIDIAILHF